MSSQHAGAFASRSYAPGSDDRLARHRSPLLLSITLALACAATPLAASAQTGLRTNGTSQYVTFGAAPSLDTPTFTLECWFMREGAGIGTSTGYGGIDSAIPLIAKGRAESDGSTVDMNYFLGLRALDGVLVGDFEEGTGQASPGLNHPIVGVTPVQNNVWYHAAATFDGTHWRLYLNGNLESEIVLSTGHLPQSSSIQHGSLASALNSSGTAAGFFQGTIDEARVWNHARAGQAIKDSLSLEIASAPGLIGRWALDTISAYTTPTTVPGGVAGTVVGGGTLGPSAPFSAPPPPPPNSPPNAPTLVAPADQATQVAASPALTVGASDPDGGNLTVTYYGRVAGGTSAQPDFTLIGLPDTQYYTSGLNGGTPAMFDTQTSWIVSNRASRNIAAVVHLGDCVENGDNGGNPIEWQRGDHSMSIIEDPSTTLLAQGIPYGMCVGNHDQTPNGDASGTTTLYNQYFGSARFSGRAYYGGHYGSNNDNHYELFSASGMDFIIVFIEFDPTANPAVLSWADNVLTTYSNRRAIVASHYLIDAGNPGPFGTQGQAIYNALKGHANLFLMLCGHVVTPEGRRADTFNGHTIYTCLSDYQERPHGGDGWLRIYEFSPAHSVIRVRTYSPTLNLFEADADSSSQFTLPYDMGAGSAFQALGTASVASGANASVTWPNLAAGTAYDWYAVVSDGTKSTTGPTWRFTTAASGGGGSGNLVANGGFESGISGWTGYGSAFLTQGTEGHTGTHSLSLKGPSATTDFGCDDTPNAVTTVAKNGAIYRFSAWVKSPANKGKVGLKVFEYLGSTQQGGTANSPQVTLTSSWQQLSYDYTVRTAGTTLSLRINDHPAAKSETFLVDDVSVTLVSAPAAGATLAGAEAPPAVSDLASAGLTFSAVVAPNPLLRDGVLDFTITRAGFARADLFDASGRRVQKLMDEPSLPAGRHQTAIGARGGEPLPSGMYFYRLETAEGSLHGRFVVIQ